MKRKVKDIMVEDYIYKIWPIFHWCKCDICLCEFRREYGWEFNSDYMYFPLHNYIYSNIYLCCDCIKTKKEAIKYIKKHYL